MKLISLKEFKENIESKEENVIIDFFSTWCAPCQMLSPIIEEIAKENTNVNVYKVNVDDEEEFAIQFGVTSIPTVVFLKNGIEKNRINGFVPKANIQEEINNIFM